MARRGLSAEMSSIVLALAASAASFLFFKFFPDYSPEQAWVFAVPGWLSLGYITVQLWMLLDSALRVRPTSVIDAVLAIAPVVTGIVCFVLVAVDYLHLSWFQLNALSMLVATGVVEFVSTLWVRNVVLQRGVSVLPHDDSNQ
jgi:hypothetical protein